MLSTAALAAFALAGSGCKDLTGSGCAAYTIKCHQVQGGVEVVGGIVPEKCDCPSNATFAGKDNITAGGPYNMYQCK